MINNLRIIAILEGISYLLLGITMPLKYMMGMPQPNYYVGMAHGVLFIAYCALVVYVAFKRNWTMKLTLLSLVASLIPFGTFYAEWKWFRKMNSQ
jgi:integral membrane protein